MHKWSITIDNHTRGRKRHGSIDVKKAKDIEDTLLRGYIRHSSQAAFEKYMKAKNEWTKILKKEQGNFE